jgi:hypothetical protein
VSEPRSTALGALDRASQLISNSWPRVALLWLTILPSRFLLMFLAWEIWRAREVPRAHAGYLTELALLTLAAWLISLYGRLRFVRSCQIGIDRGERVASARLSLGFEEFIAYAWWAVVIEALFWLCMPTLFLPVALLLLGGLLPACLRASDGRLRPLTALVESIAPGRLLVAGVLCLGIILLVGLNLHLGLQLALSLWSSVAAADVAIWSKTLDIHNPLYAIILVALALTAAEPFWLATCAYLAHAARSKRTGDDLLLWFSELKREST